MNNYKITLQYDGHRYNGWQKQGNTSNTIQGLLENLISIYLKSHFTGQQSVDLNGSGRTDAGVNAYAQVANFKTRHNIDISGMQETLNKSLPDDIRIISIERADEHFHARLSATSKYYSYYIDNRNVPDVFMRNFSLRVETPLELDNMKKAAAMLCGEHDFASFCTPSKSSVQKSTVRTIYDISITERSGIIKIIYHGNGFLYNMVRILTGTLIEIGEGKRLASDIPSILQKHDRTFAGPTVPANALFLESVQY